MPPVPLPELRCICSRQQPMDTEEPNPASSRRTRSLRQRVGRASVLYILVPYFAVTIIFAVFQRRLMYQPTVADRLSITDSGLGADFGIDVELTTADGYTLRGWLINGRSLHEQDRGNAPLVLYFPGNSLNRSERINELREVAARGFDVLIFDYRGFGDSTGSPTESTLSADAMLVWQYARNTLGYDERRIVVFGESIGGAVALSMWSTTNSRPPQPATLILNSTFSSMPQTVEWHYPLFPFRFLLLDRWPSIERIGRVHAPIIVFHGTDDKIVPVAHAHALADASSTARLIEIPGGAHNEIPMLQLRTELDGIMATLQKSDNHDATDNRGAENHGATHFH